ncbi:alanyl-tRNA editing protein [Mesobacillus subterraneus]|uniref:Alanyl-tRNA editing protein n=1 Tax=Mesobacillus subterraneus TaxID=285983 RepID=A0A427TV35_9BACI|nr:DHHA1 domain-containing protein [Mesobacillus subterraneus]RSD28261.1 alanyl-tRNA editing protein [Mesobacillus subterraneus]
MEQKLYYQDAYMKSFTAELLKQEHDEDGRLYVVLSQTAFYPTGGGQPFDTGTLNAVKVVDVEETGGEIRHYIDAKLEESTEIEGEIDWERRFDHMQQHAGQHILSAAFEDLFGYKTVSFHLGKETLTIDLETESLSAHEAQAAEELANQIILENRPILTKWVNSEEVRRYKLRKELSVTEDIRLVIIPEFDYNGCGGTHPDSTGQVTSLKILGWERQKKMVRIEFVCGRRVLEQLGKKHTVLQELTALLNAPEQDMADAVKRMLEQRKELDKMIEESREQLLRYEAAELVDAGTGMIVSKVFQNRTIQELQKLARLLVSQAEDRVFLLAAENEDKLQFVFARGKQAEADLKRWNKEALAIIDGKGGGNDFLVQGGGRLIRGEQFLSQLLEKIR